MKRTGHIIGVLIIVQMVGAFMVNFVLEAPLFGVPGFLVNAAPHSQQIALGALLGLATEALWVAVAVTLFPIIYRGAPTIALWFVTLAAVALATAVVENAAVMSMVSVSEAYAKAGAPDRGLLDAARVVVSSARNWPHFIARMLDGCTIFVLYAALYRLALVPRVLAGFGLIAAVLQISAVGMPLFGYAVLFPMLAPLGLSQLALVSWLMAKGLRE